MEVIEDPNAPAAEDKPADDDAEASEAREQAEAAKAERERQAALQAQLAAMEEEVARQEAQKETERKAAQAETEKELIAAAGMSPPSVSLLKIVLTNDVDAESSTAERHTGYSEVSTGVAFSDANVVTGLRRGSQAARDGKLRVGDTVIAIEGNALEGERVGIALNAKKQVKYELTVARAVGDEDGSGGKGDYSGWVHAVRGKDGKALTGQSVRRFWMVLDGTALLFKDGQRGRVIKERTIQLKGAVCKVPVTQLKGQTLKQPPLIQSLIEKQRFPFTLLWPQGEVSHDLILASSTSADRTAWTKAINKKLTELKAQAPTEGWLMKKSGRKGNTGFGLSGLLTSGWKRRWFVLSQPDEEIEGSSATFRYFTNPTDTTALGAVVINAHANIYVAGDESTKPNSFCITSQGSGDKAPITTVLACKSGDDLKRWMKAVRRAITNSGGEVQSAGQMARAVEERAGKLQKVSKQTANLIALSKLDREDLQNVQLKKLYEVAAYMTIQLPPDLEPKATKKLKDKRELQFAKDTLIELIRAANLEKEALHNTAKDLFAVQKSAKSGEKRLSIRPRGTSTWESEEGMSGRRTADEAPDIKDGRPARNGDKKANEKLSRRISESGEEPVELM